MGVVVGAVVDVDVEVLVDAEVLVVGSEVVDVDVEVAVDVAVVEDVGVEVVVDVWTPGPWRPQPPAKRTADKITQATTERAKARFKESLLVESFAGRSYESASPPVDVHDQSVVPLLNLYPPHRHRNTGSQRWNRSPLWRHPHASPLGPVARRPTCQA